jgi:glycerophosphoryl diester phosphodiesterase
MDEGRWAAPRTKRARHRDMSVPLNLGHRGASAAAPANTLAAFRLAMELGADGFELDVQLTADNELVVIHDFSVDHTTNGSGLVRLKNLEDLKRLDAGVRFAPRFSGERIPTLREVFAQAGKRPFINVEIKTASPRGNGLEPRLVALIREHGLGERLVVSSFNPFALWRMRRLAPDLKLALLYADDLPRYLRDRWLAFLSHPSALNPKYSMASAGHVRWAQEHGYGLFVWTVDDEAEMRRLISLGVTGIITNKPDVLKKVLSES